MMSGNVEFSQAILLRPPQDTFFVAPRDDHASTVWPQCRETTIAALVSNQDFDFAILGDPLQHTALNICHVDEPVRKPSQPGRIGHCCNEPWPASIHGNAIEFISGGVGD